VPQTLKTEGKLFVYRQLTAYINKLDEFTAAILHCMVYIVGAVLF